LVVALGAHAPVLVTVLHVVTEAARDPTLAGMPATSAADGFTGAEVTAGTRADRHAWRSTAGAYCHQATSWLRLNGVRARGEVRSGDVVEEVARAALEEADCVVMATRARAGVTRWAPDSIADRLMRRLATPVLVLRSNRTQPVLPAMLTPLRSPAAVPGDSAHVPSAVAAGSRRGISSEVPWVHTPS
jgi:nucleotide-binding universal stress UspA family protein